MLNANGTDCCGGATKGSEASASSALDILKERFARGEIDKAEFEERRQVLSASPEENASHAGDGKSCCCR